MTSIIKVDTVQDIDGNNIISENANTITIGASGDTISIPAGATLVNSGTATGFGLTTQSVQTTGFTAVKGNLYPCNTTSAAFTVTLPASPSIGDQIGLLDYAGTFDTNKLTINPNGNKIEGSTDNLLLSVEREGVTLTYIDSTQGWLASSGINEGTDALQPTTYSIDFLVVAGGGGGGGGGSNNGSGGGGGAGGFRTSTQTANIGTVITVTVGDGGTAGVYNTTRGGSGSGSSISGSGLTTITSAGGGGGASGQIGNGLNGGSGGGGAGFNSLTGGTGNTPSTSPSQGNNGGTGTDAPNFVGGGGGGAGAVGVNGSGVNGGAGGAGTASSITGSSVTRAGGGGAGGSFGGGSGGSGGTGGGGNGGTSAAGTAGTANLGGGGGGGSDNSVNGGAGGKGVVILSVPTAKYSSTTTGSPTVTTSGANTILQFNGDGSYTV